jgi:hypothetical protein
LLGYCVEPAISLHLYTVPLVQWSTRLLPVKRDTGSIPRKVLMWNRNSPVSVVTLHWWPWHDLSLCLLLGRNRPKLGRRADNVIIPLDLTQLFCPGFTLAGGPHFGFTTDIVGCWGRSPMESLQSHCIHTQFHWSSGPPFCFPSWGTRVQSPGGVLMWNRDSPVSVVSPQYVYFNKSSLYSCTL